MLVNAPFVASYAYVSVTLPGSVSVRTNKGDIPVFLSSVPWPPETSFRKPECPLYSLHDRMDEHVGRGAAGVLRGLRLSVAGDSALTVPNMPSGRKGPRLA